jgi:nitrite reductase/ring-hydroxylating ferredoxin subunit
MGLVRTLVVGRSDGLRSRLRSMLGLGSAPAARPAPTVSPGAFGGGGSGAAPTASVRSEPAEKALRLNREPPKNVTPPEGYEVVLHKDALEKGRIIEIIIAGKAIAVANVEGSFYAINNACPHAEGPLGEGGMDGTLVTCPYHGWQFDVTDGSCKTNPYSKVQTYPVQVVDSAVCVKL